MMQTGRATARPRAARTVLLLAALALASCGGVPDEGTDAGSSAQRIVSLAPNLTEILFALDLGDRVVGVTDYCDYPPAATGKPKVGGYVNPNLEAILELEPDLAVAAPNVGNRDAVLRLESLGVELLIVETPTLDALYDAIRIIARGAGVPERGAALADRLHREIEAIRRQVAARPPTRTLMVFSHDPLIVAGAGTFFDDMISAAGGANLAAEAGGRFPHYSLEQLVGGAPEAIIDTVMGSEGEPDLSFWKRWNTVPAVRDGRVCAPPLDAVVRPGPRAPEGIRHLADCLHPGVVAEAGEEERR